MNRWNRTVLFFVIGCSSMLGAEEFTLKVIGGSYKGISSTTQRSLSALYSSYVPLSLDNQELSALLREKPSRITLSLPSGLPLPQSISLKEFSALTPTARFVVVTEKGEQEQDFAQQWASYLGSIEGNPRSIVVVTFSRFGMEAMIDLGDRTYFIKGAEYSPNSASQQYVFFDGTAQRNRDPFRCGIDDTKGRNSSRREALQSYPQSGMPPDANKIDSYIASQSDFSRRLNATLLSAPAISSDTIEVSVAMDCDFSVYQAKGNSFDSVTVLMLNTLVQSSAVYLRDLSVTLKSAFIRVWSVPAPFATTDIGIALQQFKNYWVNESNSVNRTVSHLFSMKYTGTPGIGGIAYLNALCSDKDGYGVTVVDTVSNGHLLTFAHELGHNFGSYHTHSCLWPNGPIDHCSDIEGGCGSGPNVDTVGTIMSYCSTRNLEFHPVCATLMRRVVETSWCAPSKTTVAVAQADSSFLHALYTSTGGTSWIKKTNWDSAFVKGRYGVAIRSGRVVSIDLPANNLVGTIPAGLSNLTALRRLNLSGRNYHHDPWVAGRNPSEFLFNQNSLSGPIPSGIDQLTALEFLDLSNTQLSGTIPTDIGNLTQLRWLNLSEMQGLTGSIPASIGTLQNLEVFDLYRTTGISGTIPAELTNLSQLRILMIESKNITGSIPAAIGNLSKLAYLNLSDNKLSGSIPASITTMTSLEFLQLNFNQLSGAIPADIGNLKSLGSLALNDNALTGDIPASMANLTKLQSFNLARNQLTGSIPAFIGDMNLLGLYLSENKLTGTIPIALGKLGGLLEFEVQGNQLGGTIPDTLRNLGKNAPGEFGGLVTFRVGNNLFTGAVPSWLAQKTVLSHLDLGGNNFTPIDSIPQWILSLPSPYRLLLSGLGIKGAIPAALTAKTSLGELDLSNNQLTGTIPAALGNLTNLTLLNLSHNQLTGPVPPELGSVTNFMDVRLSHNQLTDTIPGFFGQYFALRHLDLSHNKFAGKAPKMLLASPSLRIVRLSDNDLTGLPDPPNLFVFFSDTTTRIEIQNNRLLFDGVKQYVEKNYARLTYAPQKPFGLFKGLFAPANSPVTLTMDISGSGNSYQWYKDTLLIAGATDSAYVIPELSAADTGKYTGRVTNPAAPLLTLVRNPYFVSLSGASFPGRIALVSPDSGAQDVAAPVELTWNHDSVTQYYTVEVDSTGSFASPLFKKDTVVESSPSVLTLSLPALPSASGYFWRVRGVNGTGAGNWSQVWAFTVKKNTTGAPLDGRLIPKEYALGQNFPNPFNPTTTIQFQIPQSPFTKGDKGGFVSLKIFDLLGRDVATLVNEEKQAGYYSVRFDARALSSGIYFYRIEAGEFTQTKRLMLLK